MSVFVVNLLSIGCEFCVIPLYVSNLFVDEFVVNGLFIHRLLCVGTLFMHCFVNCLSIWYPSLVNVLSICCQLIVTDLLIECGVIVWQLFPNWLSISVVYSLSLRCRFVVTDCQLIVNCVWVHCLRSVFFIVCQFGTNSLGMCCQFVVGGL